MTYFVTSITMPGRNIHADFSFAKRTGTQSYSRRSTSVRYRCCVC